MTEEPVSWLDLQLTCSSPFSFIDFIRTIAGCVFPIFRAPRQWIWRFALRMREWRSGLARSLSYPAPMALPRWSLAHPPPLSSLCLILSSQMSKHAAGMHNDEGKNVELYIPRKCSATNRIIGAKDHAAIQVCGAFAEWRLFLFLSSANHRSSRRFRVRRPWTKSATATAYDFDSMRHSSSLPLIQPPAIRSADVLSRDGQGMQHLSTSQMPSSSRPP